MEELKKISDHVQTNCTEVSPVVLMPDCKWEFTPEEKSPVTKIQPQNIFYLIVGFLLWDKMLILISAF